MFLKDNAKETLTFQIDDEEIVPNFCVAEFGIIRYYFEHKFLVNEFFNNTELFLKNLLLRNGVMKMFNNICIQNHIKNPYTEEIFHFDVCKYDQENILFRIELPTPQYTPLCFRIYFIYNMNNKYKRCFTIEKGTFGTSSGFLCEWTKDCHLTYGETEHANWRWEDDEGVIKKALETRLIMNKVMKGEM